MDRAVPGAIRRSDGLQPILDRMVRVEADDTVGDLRIVCELTDGGSALLRLL